MQEQFQATKILFIDNDETAFEVRQCMAKVLGSLPPVKLFHAKDATEALSMLDELKPDVVVLDDEQGAEKDLFMDSLHGVHPPIVVRSETHRPSPKEFRIDQSVTYIPKSDSLEGIHDTLVLITAIGVRATNVKGIANSMH